MLQKLRIVAVILDRDVMELSEDGTQLLGVTVAPAAATNQQVSWVSLDESIATVLGGRVRAVGTGETTVLCVAQDDTDVVAECRVTVCPHPACVVTIDAGEGAVLSVTALQPDDDQAGVGGTPVASGDEVPYGTTLMVRASAAPGHRLTEAPGETCVVEGAVTLRARAEATPLEKVVSAAPSSM